MYRFPFLPLLAAASLVLGACQESSPLGPGESGNPDLPGSGSSFHESGAVQSASLSGSSQMTILLGGNVEVRVTDATVIDAGGDLTTFDEVLAAIDAGIPVRIELDGTVSDGVIIATQVRFETDGVGAADDEVHAFVAAVDVAARTVTLADGRAIRIASDALIDPEGDFLTLAQVAAALSAGLEVRVEADLGPITQGLRDATGAKFESDQADGPPGNGGNPPGNPPPGDGGGPAPGGGGGSVPNLGDDEVHGIVATVDLAARTVTLADGRVFRVTTDAAIETDGDFLTLASVADALAAGLEVRVEADLATPGDGVREAMSAKFESDQADGPDDDQGDDNSGPGNGDDGDDDNSGPGNGGDDNSGPGNGDDDADDDDPNDDEVEGVVASVDLAARTVTTSSGRVIRVATDAMIEADGDILTLAEVATRLASGAPIRVEAHGSSEGGVFVATLAKFEVDD